VGKALALAACQVPQGPILTTHVGYFLEQTRVAMSREEQNTQDPGKEVLAGAVSFSPLSLGRWKSCSTHRGQEGAWQFLNAQRPKHTK